MQTPVNRKKMLLFDKAILILLIFYFTEVVFGGPGSWSKDYLHIDLRRAFFGLLSVFLLMNAMINSRTLRMVDISVFIVGNLSFMFWVIFLPELQGKNQLYAIIDGTPLFFMFVVTWLFTINAIKWKNQDITLYNKICDFVFILSIISAVLHIIIYVLLTFYPALGFVLLDVIKSIFDSEDRGNIYIGPMPDGSIRVFWLPSLFMLYGVYRLMSKIIYKISIQSIVLLLIFFAAILITQTRSIQLGLLIGALFAFLLNFYVRMRLFSKAYLSIIVTLILASITFFQIEAASPDFISFLGLSRGDSDDSRILQIGPLLDAWLQNIFVGNGFGAQASHVRSLNSPFSYEMSILALYMKMGILGALLSSFYFIYLTVSLLPTRNSIIKKRKEFIALFILVFSLCFTFNTNPYLSNSVGVAIVLLICIEVARLSAPEPVVYS